MFQTKFRIKEENSFQTSIAKAFTGNKLYRFLLRFQFSLFFKQISKIMTNLNFNFFSLSPPFKKVLSFTTFNEFSNYSNHILFANRGEKKVEKSIKTDMEIAKNTLWKTHQKTKPSPKNLMRIRSKAFFNCLWLMETLASFCEKNKIEVKS